MARKNGFHLTPRVPAVMLFSAAAVYLGLLAFYWINIQVHSGRVNPADLLAYSIGQMVMILGYAVLNRRIDRGNRYDWDYSSVNPSAREY